MKSALCKSRTHHATTLLLCCLLTIGLIIAAVQANSRGQSFFFIGLIILGILAIRFFVWLLLIDLRTLHLLEDASAATIEPDQLIRLLVGKIQVIRYRSLFGLVVENPTGLRDVVAEISGSTGKLSVLLEVVKRVGDGVAVGE